ncbi:MAG: HAMP domain-containing histidine kinase, partial [Ignavibacteriae bacterium]|nr:HAMP domain-containing histidine kinase [Ignavibacteriota bacterium]
LYDVKGFAENIATLVEPNLKEKHIEFQKQVNCNCFCTFDKERLSRAFLNIINNAEDAMPNGGNILFQVSRANGNVVFEVKDSGSGIPEEIKEKLFQPFATFGKKKGTGLGLAITKKIIEEHRGEVSVESFAGKGTTFKVKLPA